VHDLEDSEKHCITCQQDLRPIGEECSERYEYIPAQLTVIEDVCRKYACACTVKTATKPPQPIEKSTAGASLLAQVIVAKTVDHLPLNRQEKIFERHGVEISRKTMCGWMAQCAHLLQPLYGSLKEVLFQSRVIGTDDTSVKVQGGKTAAVLRTLGVLPTCWSRSLPLAQGCAFTDRHASDHPDRRVTAAQLGARPRLTLIGFSPIARAGLSPVLLVILGRLQAIHQDVCINESVHARTDPLSTIRDPGPACADQSVCANVQSPGQTTGRPLPVRRAVPGYPLGRAE